MKKLLIIFSLFIFLGPPVYADKLLKNGFLTKNMGYDKDQNINNPSNTIIIIYNHGQKSHDKKSSSCSWKNNVRNEASLINKEINGKQIKLYHLCTHKLAGDDKNLWKKNFKPPYKGKPKLEKRLDANLDIIDKFVKMGVPHKQIFISGHSCGGWMTMMLLARHQDKVGGGISYMPACYGKLTQMFKVKKLGVDKALAKFKKKTPGPSAMRNSQIDKIKKSKNLPILVFTHPRDAFEGLLSDWVEEIPGVKRIVISENDEVDGKSCHRIGINSGTEWKEKIKIFHWISQADCFQYYNQTILDYIASRI